MDHSLRPVRMGGNGYGGNRGAAAATTTDLQSGFDTQSILNKLNGINSGICDGFYAVNTSLLQGFNGQQMATMQGDYNMNKLSLRGNVRIARIFSFEI